MERRTHARIAHKSLNQLPVTFSLYDVSTGDVDANREYAAAQGSLDTTTRPKLS